MLIQAARKLLKEVLYGLHIDVTRNMQYDRQTFHVMKRLLSQNSNCIDIGCHKGEMLALILKLSPTGTHLAFEPIPYLYEKLRSTFIQSNISISKVALSNEKGSATFNLVTNAPAFSGLRQRTYPTQHPKIEKITVETDLLDNLIAANYRPDFIKLDVEGAEYLVLQGAINCLRQCRPAIVFEFGHGGSDRYGISPDRMYQLLVDECRLNIFTMRRWLDHKPCLTLDEFNKCYETGSEYYFLAIA